MKMEPFLLERWLQQYDPIAKYNLAHASVTPLKLGEFFGKMDKDLPLHYTSGNGEEDLRQEISILYSNLTNNRVLVTNGATEANFITANYLIEPNDEVVVVAPTYPQMWGVITAIGARIKKFEVTEKNADKPEFDRLQDFVTAKTKAILFTNPNNPIGYVLNRNQLKTICEIAEDVGAYVWADEIFRGLEYEGETPPSVLDLYEKAVVTSGLSKMGLAGLRIGWVVSRNEELINNIWNVKDYTSTCNSAVSEHLATLALKGGKITELRERCKKIAVEPLAILARWIEKRKDAFSWFKPRAGYVSFPDCRLRVDVRQFCKELIEKNGVLVTPGDCFGFPSHIRIGYGKVEKETLAEALEVFDGVIEKHR